jgi:hypothetical protein
MSVITLLSDGVDEVVLITEIALNGEDGEDGKPGLTPYEEWLSRGNEGTYADFLRSITNGGLGDLLDAVSQDPDNRLRLGEDHKLYVPDDLSTDPLVAYILAKG